ncbi:MAG: precorrin-3B C(17)-methyltransferase [Candidatus Obscuribacterales bacterium]|nr:precorrin-3B C(17)-methyltransferase [Candidatus Obscuribacterales bacterium]
MTATGIWLVRQQALPIGERLRDELGAELIKPWESELSQRTLFEREFSTRSHWIFVGATGIAVRFLSGLAADKHRDPAVVVLDEGCRYAIALLSGHEGGANDLAYTVSSIFGGAPVITTATESVKPLVVGIGCRRGITADTVEGAVRSALNGREISEVRALATINLKKDEPGLLEFARRHNLPLQIYRAEDVAARNWVTTPSQWVKQTTGADGVCEPCALMANPRGQLIVRKKLANGVAVAISEDTMLPGPSKFPERTGNLHSREQLQSDALEQPQNGILHSVSREQPQSGVLHLVSTGPGASGQLTPAATKAINESNVIVGYSLYLELLNELIKDKEIVSAPLTQERERANAAVEAARAGKKVALLSSGDIGVYAMATLAFELTQEEDTFEILVHPGVTAALASASLLGAPLSHDFATLSLSDLLCPWKWIEERAWHIAAADLCVAFYNVQSKSRPDGVYKIIRLMLEHKSADTICGVVRNAYRQEQTTRITTLGALLDQQFDMFTTIVIGNRFTKRIRNHIYTPRGYHAWSSHERSPVLHTKSENSTTSPNARAIITVAMDDGIDTGGIPPAPLSLQSTPSANVKSTDLPNRAVWVFSGTGDGNDFANNISSRGVPVVVSAATAYGARAANRACPSSAIMFGSLGREARSRLLKETSSRAIIDATHPFAHQMSEQLIELSAALKIPYIRFERPKLHSTDRCHRCPDFETAASLAAKLGTRILLTTGSKNIASFAGRANTGVNWFARITPNAESLQALLDAGIPETNICAMQGPFSTDSNVALCRQWNIDCIVTKDSGDSGGLAEKFETAEALNIPLVLIERPSVDYPLVVSSWDELDAMLKEIGVLLDE